MFGIEKDFQNLMEQVYGPLNKDKMTEIEELKGQIKVLQKKLSFLEELEKTKSPAEEAYKRVYAEYPMGEPFWVVFKNGYEQAQEDYKVGEYQETAQKRGERIHKEMEETIKIHDGYGVVDYKPTPQSPVEEAYKDWWGEYPGDENWTSDATRWQGFQAGYNAAYEEKVAQEPEENEWKSVALRFGEKLSGYLSDGYYELSPAAWFRWAVFTYGKGQQIKDAVRESVEWCEENPDKDPLDWLKPQTPEETAQSLKEAFVKAQKTEKWKEIQKLIDEEDNDKNFKNSLDLIKEWGEKNKPLTLYDKLETWINYGNFAQSRDVLVNEIVNIVKDWLPPSNDKNSYEWEKCLKMMYGNLR